MKKFIVNQDRDEAIELQGGVALARPTKNRPFHQIVIYDGCDWFALGNYNSEKKAEQVFQCLLGFIAQQSSSLFYMPEDEKCN